MARRATADMERTHVRQARSTAASALSACAPTSNSAALRTRSDLERPPAPARRAAEHRRVKRGACACSVATRAPQRGCNARIARRTKSSDALTEARKRALGLDEPLCVNQVSSQLLWRQRDLSAVVTSMRLCERLKRRAVAPCAQHSAPPASRWCRQQRSAAAATRVLASASVRATAARSRSERSWCSALRRRRPQWA